MRPGLVVLLKFSFFHFFHGGTQLILGPLIDFLLFSSSSWKFDSSIYLYFKDIYLHFFHW